MRPTEATVSLCAAKCQRKQDGVRRVSLPDAHVLDVDRDGEGLLEPLCADPTFGGVRSRVLGIGEGNLLFVRFREEPDLEKGRGRSAG